MSIGLGNAGGMPGISSKVESLESQVWWGHENLQIRDPGPILGAAAVDAGATPTTALRGGLVLAKKTADGLWYEYDATQTDGREVAQGVLERGISTLGRDSVAAKKSWFVLIGGLLKASELKGLDALARQHLSARFIFDDDVQGAGWCGPHLKEISKAADYTIVAADNFSEFVMTATGTLTLPAIGKGYRFRLRSEVDAAIGFLSPEGTNIIALDNLAATTAKFQTANMMIGASAEIYTNEAGTKWVFKNTSAGLATVTLT